MPTLPAMMPIAPTTGSGVFKKLVVAYDFSPYADTALDYALDLATRQNSKVTLVHVQSASNHEVACEDLDAAHKVSRDLSERLEQIADRCRGLGVDTRWLLRAGSPADVLTRTVADLKPDILFLGAYGNDRLDRKVLGSTAEHLLRTLPCPGVTVGPKAVKENSDSTEAEKVICPIDFPEDVDDRLRIIARLAKALHADVELVHAVDVCHEYSRPHNAADTQFEFDLLVARLLREGVATQSALLYGVPERVISERAQAVNAHYIMFGLHKDGHFSSYFRKSLVARVIKNAPCAIFTFPQPIEAGLQEVERYSTGEEFELAAQTEKCLNCRPSRLSFRNTLVRLGQDLCQSPEAFRAWSQNLGHEKVLTTFTSYGAVACDRQGEIIRGLATPQEAVQSGVNEIAEAVFKRFRDSGLDVRVN